MVRSKSGAIRSALGPRKKRLQDLLETATAIIDVTEPDNDIAKQQLTQEIEVVITRLENAISVVGESDKQWQNLIAGLPDDEADDEQVLYDDTASSDTGYINLIDDSKECACLLRLKITRLKSVTVVAATNNSDFPIIRDARKTAKLPKLILPTFSGDPLTWSQFYCIFKTNIDDSELDGIEKLTYLRGQLRGVALEAIEGLAITNDSYEVAKEILIQRFERSPEQLVSSWYSQLKRLPQSSGRIDDLRKTYDCCEKIFRQLKNAGEDIDANRSLTMDVWSKYPVSVVKELSRMQNVSTHSKLSEIQAALKRYIDQTDNLRDMLGELEPFQTDSGKSAKTRDHQRSDGSNSSRACFDNSPWSTPNTTNSSALTSVVSQTKSKPRFPCCFCGDVHFNSECNNYRTREQRMQRLTEISRCQRCLGNRHETADCDSLSDRVRCYYCRSSGTHISALCPKEFGDHGSITKPGSAGSTTVAQTSKRRNEQSTSCALSFDEQALLSTAVTTITNPETGRQQRAKIIFDSGSHRSYITEHLADSLGLLQSRNETISVSVFGTSRALSVPSGQVEISISARSGKNICIAAHTTPTITNCSLTLNNLPNRLATLVKSIQHEMADDMSVDGPPEVLIGSDYFWEFVTGTRMRTDDGIFVIPSILGLILGGRFRSDADSKIEQTTLLCLTERTGVASIDTGLTLVSMESRSKQPYPDVEDYWSLERIGITDDPLENEDEVALNKFNDSVYFSDGRYCVSWPWKSNKCQLPSNYQLACGRLRSLAKRLAGCDDFLPIEYDKVINAQMELGIIEEVPPSEIETSKNWVHYLPHHPVLKADHSTTKVRIVYDASAKCRKDDVSLNECMYRGPVILPDLCAILLRFRVQTIAIIADIEKAFLQISLDPSQRDVTRFVWFRNPEKLDIDDIVVYRFARVPFGVISSPFLLAATIQCHLKQINTPTANVIRNNIYVDNVICGACGEKSSTEFYDEAKTIFRSASMNLREWTSNSPVLRKYIPSEDRCAKKTPSVLGLKWNTDSDMLQLNSNWTKNVSCASKRDVLRAIASIYDPLGMFQPCTVRLKMFLRELWNKNSDWDGKIDDQLRKKWLLLHSETAAIFDYTFPRRVSLLDEYNLVVFSDASAEAYATAIYLRTFDKHGSKKWTTDLIYSKSRLSPKSQSKHKTEVSIPKLELLGLTIGTRAANFVRKSLFDALPVKTYLLTDSLCVLSWLQSSRSLPVFVSNRVKEIKSLNNAEFRHVNSEDNPADMSTRGVSGQTLASSKLWWHGPPWLELSDAEWHTKSNFDAITDVELRNIESIPHQPVFHSLFVGAHVKDKRVPGSYPMGIDPTKYSSLRRLLRVTCRCLKFLKYKIFQRCPTALQRKPILQRLFDKFTTSKTIIAPELCEAKQLWIRHVQQNKFEDVSEAIRSNRQHHLTQQLNLRLDDRGLIRSEGRLALADLSDDARQPMLLPYDDHITNLFINDVHIRLLHSGVNHTLSQVRREYWIPRGRNAVRKVITKCLVCRKAKGYPFARPQMPPWPKERVSRSQPFQFTGVDYFGPVNVIVNETQHKMWVALFTCLTVRAVHLEPVFDCTAESFLNCISRFISRRGAPEQIISDNAPQFRLAKTLFDRSWHQVLRDDGIQTYISDKGIKWRFTTELAPWMGGVYERIVGLVKNTYKIAVGRRLLKYEEFLTLITEVESIVNSRPITYVYSDIASGYALRPVDFLAGLSVGTPCIDPSLSPVGGDASKNLIRVWKAKQRRLDIIWKQWYSDYLLSMRERGGMCHKNGRNDVRSSTPVKDEVVIVKNEDAPRGMWKLGRVVDVIPGSDGVIRSADVILPNKQVIRRPISHLYRLEIPTIIESSNSEFFRNGSDDEEPFDGFTAEEAEAFGRPTVSITNPEPDAGRRKNRTLSSSDQEQIFSGLAHSAAPIFFGTN